MKWTSIKDRLPKEYHQVLITNHEYLDPTNPRFYIVAEWRGGLWQEPDVDPDDNSMYLFEPDFWCEIEPPE